MKQIIITAFAFLVFISHVDAQNIKEFVIEPAPETDPSVFLKSCNSPQLGVVVFKTAITGLWFEMYPSSKLVGMRQNRQRNEYVMCVEPTDGKYRFTITHDEYESIDFFVEDIKPNQAQFFRINTKGIPSGDDNSSGQSTSTEEGLKIPPNLNLKIVSSTRQMEVEFVKSELSSNGKVFILEFLVTNLGQDQTWNFVYEDQEAIDNLGNKGFVHISSYPNNRWGTGGGNQASNLLQRNTPVNIKIEISGVSSQATYFP